MHVGGYKALSVDLAARVQDVRGGVKVRKNTLQRSDDGCVSQCARGFGLHRTDQMDSRTDLGPDEDDRRPGTVVADLLYPGVADVSVGDVVVDGEAKEEDVLK